MSRIVGIALLLIGSLWVVQIATGKPIFQQHPEPPTTIQDLKQNDPGGN